MLELIKNVFGFGKSATDFKSLKEQGALIVDVRSKQEFNQGHYQKALNIPLDQIGREIPKLKKKCKKRLLISVLISLYIVDRKSIL